MTYTGLDYHTDKSYVSIFNEENEEIFEGEITSTELPGFFESLPKTEVLFEAGYGWPRLVRILAGSGVKLQMCHPEANSDRSEEVGPSGCKTSRCVPEDRLVQESVHAG